jgi:TolA-binding protein
VPDATNLLGQAALKAGNFDVAAATFKKLQGNPAYRQKALLNEATARKEGGNLDAAIPPLEALLAKGVSDDVTASGVMLLASVYAQKGEGKKAIEVLDKLREQTALVENVVRMNQLALELGDRLLKDGQPAEALACYRLVLSRDAVITLQNARIAKLQAEIEAKLQAVRADPTKASWVIPEVDSLRKSIAEMKKLVADFEKLPDFQPGLWLRLGRSYAEMGDKWEAVTVYDELLRKYPQTAEREGALYGLMVASADANRPPEKTQAVGEAYLKDFPNGPNAQVVGYLLGATALQANDSTTAESFFGRMLESQKSSVYREEMRFLLANARFAQAKYDQARKDYETYLAEYPSGVHAEEVIYRIGLTSLFGGNYDAARKELGAYLEKYPQGTFRADAKYRLAVCDYAASKFPEVIAACRAWEKEYPNDPMLGEVLALEADAQASEGDQQAALDLYIRSYKAASTDEVLNYSLFAAQKILQQAGDWERMTAMLDEFVQKNPAHPSAVTAIYWISKAKTRDGKVDEARKYVADAIRKNIDDPTLDPVEQLLTQLAQLCLRKSPEGAAPADPAAELARLLGGDDAKNPLARARILYAQAELARLQKKPAEEAKALQTIADQIPTKDLSAPLLARVGNYLVTSGNLDKAQAFFNRILEKYGRSDFAEYGYCGLGQIAYARGKYEQALQLFNDAVAKGAAAATLKDVTVGKAQSLLALGRLKEAKETFAQVASVREWRGDATALSVYSLGEIEQREGRLPEAIAYYQRVYVAYRKYLPWVAKAYIKSAECFKKLGKTQEAANTYKEMLANQNLAAFPEFNEARKQLAQLGNG